MTPLMALNDLEGLFCCLKPFCLTYLWKYSVRYVYTWSEKHAWLVISTIFLKTKGFSRLQPVTYPVNVVISRKRCQTESLLLQTTNRKWYMAYRTEAILMTLSNLQGHSFPTESLSIVIFVELCSSWQDFNGHSTSSCGLSAVWGALCFTLLYHWTKYHAVWVTVMIWFVIVGWYDERLLLSLDAQDQLVTLASQALEEFWASLVNEVQLETRALMELLVGLVLLDHLDHKDLKAVRDLPAHLVNQDQMAHLVTLAFRDLLVCTAD